MNDGQIWNRKDSLRVRKCIEGWGKAIHLFLGRWNCSTEVLSKQPCPKHTGWKCLQQYKSAFVWYQKSIHSPPSLAQQQILSEST